MVWRTGMWKCLTFVVNLYKPQSWSLIGFVPSLTIKNRGLISTIKNFSNPAHRRVVVHKKLRHQLLFDNKIQNFVYLLCEYGSYGIQHMMCINVLVRNFIDDVLFAFNCIGFYNILSVPFHNIEKHVYDLVYDAFCFQKNPNLTHFECHWVPAFVPVQRLIA